MKPTRILIAFILGILSMIIILVVGFTFLFDKTIEKQLIEYGQMTLNSNIIYVDTLLKSTKDLFDSISLDADISKLLNHDSLSASELLAGLRRLSKYESSNYFVDSIYMYNRASNTIYVSSPHMPEATYASSEFLDIEGASLLEHYSSISNMEPIFRIYNSIYPTISEIPYISFLRYNTLVEQNKSNVIMVNIRQDILSELIHSNPETHGSLLIISDELGQAWLISGNRDIYSEISIENINDRISKTDGSFTVESAGKKYIICHSKVLNNNANLILIEDENYIASITKTKGYGATIILLGLLFGICLILSIVALKYIWKSIMNQIATEALNEKKKKELLEAERREKLLSFLHSEAIDNNTALFEDQNMERTLLVLFIDNESVDLTATKKEVCNITCDLLKDYNPITAYESDERCIAIISEKSNDINLEDVKSKIEEALDISLTLFISKATDDISTLPESYEFLSKSIPYRFIFGKGSIITTSMIDEHEMTATSIPTEILSSLTSAILKLDIPAVELLLKEIIAIIGTGSYRNAQFCLVNLSIAIDDAICRLQINNGIEKTVIAGSLIYRSLKLESIDEILDVVRQILMQIEKSITQSKNNRQSEIIAEIVRITKEHCYERDFSINTISSIIGMTPAYLGKIFKRTLGISFSRFVLNERMDQACRLLAETDTPIENIVYSVGFGDTPYFYKLFKQINGCTPMKYREEHTHSI